MTDRIPNPLFVPVSCRVVRHISKFEDRNTSNRPSPEIMADNHIGTVGFGWTHEVIDKEQLYDQLPFLGT